MRETDIEQRLIQKNEEYIKMVNLLRMYKELDKKIQIAIKKYNFVAI